MLHARALARIQLLTCCVCVPPPPQPLHNHIRATCACVFIKFQRPGRCRGQFCFLLPWELTKGSLRAVHHSPALYANVGRFLSACFNEMNSTPMQYVCFSSIFFVRTILPSLVSCKPTVLFAAVLIAQFKVFVQSKNEYFWPTNALFNGMDTAGK